jgi:aryl-alcohol dehydrogenase-like predicted oxidoreductase
VTISARLHPRIGLGCVTFGREITEAASFEIMDYALEHGITLFDTAEAYGLGHASETIIGRWLRSRRCRESITLVTKITTSFNQRHVREALTASLERLGTDYTDLYLFHSFDASMPQEESVAAMDAVVKSGLARAGGCSNYSGAQLAGALEISRSTGLSRFTAIQSNYNLIAREIEDDIIPLATRENVGIITYSPLAAGFLSGKYGPGSSAIPPGTRFNVIPGHRHIYFSDRNFRWLGYLHQLAGKTGIPPLRLAMAWVLHNPAVTTMLAGARHPAHLDNALAALSTTLQEDVIHEIESWR